MDRRTAHYPNTVHVPPPMSGVETLAATTTIAMRVLSTAVRPGTVPLLIVIYLLGTIPQAGEPPKPPALTPAQRAAAGVTAFYAALDSPSAQPVVDQPVTPEPIAVGALNDLVFRLQGRTVPQHLVWTPPDADADLSILAWNSFRLRLTPVAPATPFAPPTMPTNQEIFTALIGWMRDYEGLSTSQKELCRYLEPIPDTKRIPLPEAMRNPDAPNDDKINCFFANSGFSERQPLYLLIRAARHLHWRNGGSESSRREHADAAAVATLLALGRPVSPYKDTESLAGCVANWPDYLQWHRTDIERITTQLLTVIFERYPPNN